MSSANGTEGYTNGVASSGTLWSEGMTNQENEYPNQLAYANESQFQMNLQPYELINCANNAAALAAAKYSCAAAASTYGVYPFASDEYQSTAVSQIQL